MFTFILAAELLSVNFAEPEVIDVDQDSYEIVAADEQSAVEALREKIEYHTEFASRGIASVQVVGRLEDETF